MNILSKLSAFILFCTTCCSSFAQLTLEDIFLKGKYYPKAQEKVTFLHHSNRYAVLKNTNKGQHIVVYDTKAKALDSLELYKFWVDKDLPQQYYENIELSNTDAYYLLKSNEEKMYRRAGAANYFITDAKGVIGQVGTGKLSFPQFSPDDKKLACVKYNNLYWFGLDDGIEHAVTTDGQWNSIINGKSDWVYEEELELTRAFEWNPQSDQIAYLKFDETNVKEYRLEQYYGQTYPSAFSYKYPKVGEENSKVSVWVYDLKKNKNTLIKISGYSYEYIPRLYWNATGTEVWIMLLNRHQDSLQVVAYNVNTKKIRTVYEDHADTYIDVPFAFDILNDNSFIVNSERDGYDHLYHFDANGKLIKQLTHGNFEVKKYYGADQKNKTIYYQSNEGYVAGRKIYNVNFEDLQKQVYADQAGTNDAVFSPNFHCFFNTHSSTSSPNTISIVTTDHSGSTLIEDNTAVRERFSIYPQKEFMTIPVNGVELEAWLVKPQNLDPAKKYPLFLFVYGGPGNQEVLDKWGSTMDIWFSYLALQGYVVACVDNRGSAGKGTQFEKSIYKNLGKLESADQVAAAKYFSALSYIDSNRIGIYGVSYGGFMAALCLLEGNEVFKAAVSQAPVTNWKFYDNIYTERYMRTPEENKTGYGSFNPINSANKLKGNLLLIHGIADDNVHFQNTVEFIQALNDEHKTYDLYIYPDKKHGISGGESRYDLYLKITQFLLEKL